MKKILIAMFLLWPALAHAQSTKAALTTEINTNLASSQPGGITALQTRTTLLDIINSIMPTAPVVANNSVCFSGTTGLLKDCGVAAGITALTGDVTATGPGSVASTLATVNSNVGTFGSATQASVVTVNGKGLITAVSNATVTPAVGSITGLGTGVATALAVNVGTAGAPVVNGGALGTPSSGTATNITGLPIAGLTGLGTGVAAQLATAISTAGGSTTTIAAGTSALGTGAISSATCATAVTTTATNTATTDVVTAGFNGDPTAVTGYIPSTSGMLTIIVYPTVNNVNFKVCNNTTSTITPGAITLNWRVVR